MNTYKIANKKKAQVSVSYSGGKWTFQVGKYSIILHARLGKKKAHKIGETLRASWLRTEGKLTKTDAHRIDGTARSVINRLTGQRTLADYEDEPEWWQNVQGAEPSVKMVSPEPHSTDHIVAAMARIS